MTGILYRLLADSLVLFHLVFIVFVMGGGLLALRMRRLAWLHVPCAVWGALVEFMDWTCPLTPLENLLRSRAGLAGYPGGFLEHYLIRLIYPPELTRSLQLGLGASVLMVNIAAYAVLLWKREATPQAGT